MLEIFFGRDGHRDYFAAFLGGADGENFDARGGLLQQAHIFVDVSGVGQDAGSAGDVAENHFGGGNIFGSGEIVDQWRSEDGRGGVLLDLGSVGLVDGLLGVAGRRSFVGGEQSGRDGKKENGKAMTNDGGAIEAVRVHSFSRDSACEPAIVAQEGYRRAANVMQTGARAWVISPVGLRAPVKASMRKMT